jgi:cyanophycinase-like exopeptidase
MKRKLLIFLIFVASSNFVLSQNYTSYFTGNTEDLSVEPDFGICLMGGATENDNAMKWFLEKANGGDVVVIRVTGSDGYNDYFYYDLGITINSVNTLVIPSLAAANDPYVVESLNNAEAIWIAGGDQSDYASYWKDTPVEDAINNLINVKGGVIGGTSAGMAIQGNYYFSAENGSVTSSESLLNPYNNYLTIGANDFIDSPFMNNLITDTHYNNPDRKGRHTTFLARMLQDGAASAFGIACNEYVSVCIEESGIAKVFGEYPDYPNEIAYFLQANCEGNDLPENCSPGNPLTWNNSESAVKVYKVPGTLSGENYFDLNDWSSGNGGSWQNWWVENGVFNYSTDAEEADCIEVSLNDRTPDNLMRVYNDNGFVHILSKSKLQKSDILLLDVLGREINFTINNDFEQETILETNCKNGMYNLRIINSESFTYKKIYISKL